jgi:hypothetical protein
MRAILATALLLASIITNAQVNQSLRARLEQLQVEDQRYRLILDSLLVKGKKDWNDPEVQRWIPMAQQQDSIVLAEVRGIIDKHGWLGTGQVGKKANETLFLVIQHADSATMAHYFPMLAQSYALGQSPADQYALMLDRLLSDRGQKQVYGTQLRQDPATKKFVPFPIADEKQLDVRRKKMGLPPMAAYLQRFNK